jgi:hypothetical protein
MGNSENPRPIWCRPTSAQGPVRAARLTTGSALAYRRHTAGPRFQRQVLGMVERLFRDVKVLCAVLPAAIGPEYFRESAAVINAAAGGPPDREKMGEIMRRHGLTPARPQA